MPGRSSIATEHRFAAAPPRQCWIVVAAHDHVAAAVAGGYVEVNHGKATPLERMRAGDAITCYCPREVYGKGSPLQAFTAVGIVADAPITQASDAHQPFRRAVHWQASFPAPIRPLLDALTFIRTGPHWGAAFRFGFLRVPQDDFQRIARAQGCDLDVPGAPAAPPAATPDMPSTPAAAPAGERAAPSPAPRRRPRPPAPAAIGGTSPEAAS